MKKKKSYKERLQQKTIKELKAICIRYCGSDVLRGNKDEMINSLASLLDSRRQWGIIANYKS